MAGDKGSQRGKFPITAVGMVQACRKLAVDFRREGRMKMADNMDSQAERWQAEIDSGTPNKADRDRIGG